MSWPLSNELDCPSGKIDDPACAKALDEESGKNQNVDTLPD